MSWDESQSPHSTMSPGKKHLLRSGQKKNKVIESQLDAESISSSDCPEADSPQQGGYYRVITKVDNKCRQLKRVTCSLPPDPAGYSPLRPPLISKLEGEAFITSRWIFGRPFMHNIRLSPGLYILGEEVKNFSFAAEEIKAERARATPRLQRVQAWGRWVLSSP